MSQGQPSLLYMNYNAHQRCMDDASLVAGLQRGDADAVEYVIQYCAPALYRFAYYQLQDTIIAEDVVSEVMVRMIKRIDTFVLEQASSQGQHAGRHRVENACVAVAVAVHVVPGVYGVEGKVIGELTVVAAPLVPVVRVGVNCWT